MRRFVTFALFLALSALSHAAEAVWTLEYQKDAPFGIQHRLPVALNVPDDALKVTKLELRLRGREVASLVFDPAIKPSGSHVFSIDPEKNRETWAWILQQASDNLTFDLVASDADKRSRSVGAINVKRTVEGGWRTVICVAVVGSCIIGVFLLGWKTELLRDPGPRPLHGRAPYSLGRCQMALWTVVVIWSFLYVWQYLGQTPPLSTSVLALFGIASGTALGAAVISTNKRPETLQKLVEMQSKLANLVSNNAAANQLREVHQEIDRLQRKLEPPFSTNWVADILSDGDGISLHRFQLVAWTVVLAFVFVYYTLDSLALREFDAKLLALMGISSGTYIGFKLPE